MMTKHKAELIPVPDLTKADKRDDYWQKYAEAYLYGRRIMEVRYMTQEETEILGFSKRALVFQLDDGTIWFPTCDEEGNDAGTLWGQCKGTTIRIPVL